MDSVELLLDESGEELIRQDWMKLLGAGLPSQARHTAASNRPHVTLLAAPSVPADHDAALSDLARALPLEAQSAGLVTFRTERGFVLARLVVVGGSLLELHRKVHAVLPNLPKVAPTSFPDRWVPHITLARGLGAEQLALAVELVAPDPGPLTLAHLRRWDSHQKTTTALGPGSSGA